MNYELQEKILHHVRKHPVTSTTTSVARAVGCSYEQARRQLHNLMSAGQIRRYRERGAGHSWHWEANPPVPDGTPGPDLLRALFPVGHPGKRR